MQRTLYNTVLQLFDKAQLPYSSKELKKIYRHFRFRRFYKQMMPDGTHWQLRYSLDEQPIPLLEVSRNINNMETFTI